jgi:hypothetical protein
VALSDDLESAWELNEASGDAADSHGSNTLTDTNTVGSGTGLVYAAARDFERDDSERFELADNTSLSLGDIDFTYEVWVKLESEPFATRTILAKGNGSNADMWLRMTSAEELKFSVYGSSGFGNEGVITIDSFLGTAAWKQIIVWHDSVNNEIGGCVNDGTPVTAAHSAGVRDGTEVFNLGGSADLSHFDGLVGPCRFWKRVLTSGERTELYNAGAGRDYAYITGGGGGGGFRSRIAGGLVVTAK